MRNCFDEHIGILLHAYELGALGDDEKDRFSFHLLRCAVCCNALKEFRKEAKLLRTDKKIMGIIRDAAQEIAGSEY